VLLVFDDCVDACIFSSPILSGDFPDNNHIGAADTLEKIEALLPWNVPLERIEKSGTSSKGASRSI